MSAPSLAHFQQAFASVLLDEVGMHQRWPWLDALTGQPGFAVYRNTVLKGCIDALAANYPAVQRLVGESWFRAAAAVHVRQAPPRDARLLGYGAAFPDFLETFPPASELPYLAQVARLERLWTESHMAADASLLQPGAIASLPPEALGKVRLRPHPAARWMWCGQVPAFTLWERNRTLAAGDLGDIEWRGEGVLVTRPEGALRAVPLGAAGAAFMDACARNGCVATAAADALEVDADTDLAALMALLLQTGAFAATAVAD
jgi:putative DNA-binding protein